MRVRAAVFLCALTACGPHTTPPLEAPVTSPSSSAAATTSTAAATPAYPPTRRVDQVDIFHGVAVADPYRWLEDDTSAEVQRWMTAQHDLTVRELDRFPERRALASRLGELMYVDAVGAPRRRGARYFFTRRRADQEKSVLYWRQGASGEPRVLLDPNRWSTDGSVSLSGWSVSWDGTKVAYKQSRNNSDEATLLVREVATGQDSAIDTIEGARYARPSWTSDSRGFYYTWLPVDPSIPTDERPGYAEVRLHRLGSAPEADPVVHPKTGDPSVFLGASASRDGRVLLLSVHHGWTASDAYVMDLRAPRARRRWQPLAIGGRHHYYPTAYRGQLYVHTDEGAPRYRLMQVDPRRLERSAWREIVPERSDATLDGVKILGGRLALTYLQDASSVVEIRELDGRLVRQVALPTIGTVEGPFGIEDAPEAYYSFQSFTVPPEIHELSMQTGQSRPHSKVEIPIHPEGFEVRREFCRSKDGTRISMFVVEPKGFVRDGTGRVLLEGYGGFQIAKTPEFRASIYPWLERGGVYVLANLRGGGEYGETWHRDGMLLKKQNVFDDFVATAEHLIATKVTRAERLVIRGGSNGGLLVGAAVVQRPELFGAALCAVPLLDMVRYHLFGSGKTWQSEYGSPDNPEHFKVLYGYSPYHHIEPRTPYPAMLLLSADSDDRVDPMHARKFAAALQAASTGGPVLLRIERKAGHGGADRVKAAVEKATDELSFALAHSGGP